MASRKHSRHQRHLALLRRLVEQTNCVVSYCWAPASPQVFLGRVDTKGRQRFAMGIGEFDNPSGWLFTPGFVKATGAHSIRFRIQSQPWKPCKGAFIDTTVIGWDGLRKFVEDADRAEVLQTAEKKQPLEKSQKIVCLSYSNDHGDEAVAPPKPMTRQEFLRHCGEFFDARGTHFNDFETLKATINVERSK